MFFMHLQLEGESISRQDGRESLLHAGDFTLCDSTRRYAIVFTGANRMLVLGIPNSTLRRQVGCPECLAAIPMPGSHGASGLLSQFLAQMVNTTKASTSRPAVASRWRFSISSAPPMPTCRRRWLIAPRWARHIESAS